MQASGSGRIRGTPHVLDWMKEENFRIAFVARCHRFASKFREKTVGIDLNLKPLPLGSEVVGKFEVRKTLIFAQVQQSFLG